MAANNYFGFTHSGAQYAPTGAAPYQTTQPGYAAMAPTAAAAAASYTQRAAPPAAYETAYPTAAAAQPAPYAVQAGGTAPSTAYDYAGYTVARTAQPAYDTTKTYYQQQTPTATSYTSADYSGAGGSKPAVQYSSGGGGYGGGGTGAVTRGGGGAAPKAGAYASANTTVVQPQQSQNGLQQQAAQATGYATQTYSQQQPKLMASNMHRNLSTVAEYAQPTQQRSVSQFAPKQQQQQQQLKKSFSAGGGSAAASSYQTAASGGGAAATASSYTYSSGPKPKTGSAIVMTKPASATYTNYDAALYSAASMYVAQQASGGGGGGGGGKSGGGSGYKKLNSNMSKPMRSKLPPKPQQLHYCDVCKISCAGPQTYKEHLEGQKHKKKEAAMKAGGSGSGAGGGGGGGTMGGGRGAANALRCELCDVTCTGSDAYAAHIRGAKHQKVVKLHTKLGKPIPAVDPKAAQATGGKTETNIVANKITFVASGNLGTVKTEPTTASSGGSAATASGRSQQQQSTAASTAAAAQATEAAAVKEEPAAAVKTEDVEMAASDNITPVGHEYIEEILNDEGKPISFNCKLCDCKFNDPNAKLMHMKGRRHRLQFKKKVNPDLVVDVKTSLRQRRIQEEKQRKQAMRDDFFRRREEERMMEVEERMYWEERRRYEEEMEYYEWYNSRRLHGGVGPRGGPLPPPPPMPLPPPPPPHFGGPPGPPGPKAFGPMLHGVGGGALRRIETQSNDERHVLARHAAIYPKEAELGAVQKIVSHVEKALKLVSDQLSSPPAPATPKGASKETAAANTKEERVLKGVMRVGMLAKGLLLAGDTHTQLVMLTADKPTRSLLAKVAANLPAQLKAVAPDDSYTVQGKPDDAAILVTSATDAKLAVTVTLTSPVVREQLIAAADAAGSSVTSPEGRESRDAPDLLDRAKCLESLAALRHAKWFQARVNGLQSCVMVIRVLRDLCIRNPTWAPLNSWAMELLVEKVVSSAGRPLSVSGALRRIMEALAAGALLPPTGAHGGPGLLDPCEKEPTDAAGALTAQQREDITASAQHALRLMAFRQIHKVLGMEQLQPPAKFRGGAGGPGGPRGFARKRRRDNSSGEGNDSEAGDGKKDKKDETAVTVKMEK